MAEPKTDIDGLISRINELNPKEMYRFLNELRAIDPLLWEKVAEQIKQGEPQTVAPGMFNVFEQKTVVSETLEEGSQIGSYTLIKVLGSGGMGTVYLAEQYEPLDRQVALKVLREDLNRPQLQARFKIERQSLALMTHPTIAQVYEAGTTQGGRPYFVMEYIEGTSLVSYCNDHRLSIKERIELFLQTCEGVQHALYMAT